jgi:hypothetical protein
MACWFSRAEEAVGLAVRGKGRKEREMLQLK